jgi:hypothetical protein
MTLHHAVTFQLEGPLTDEIHQVLKESFDALHDRIDWALNYHHGPNLGLPRSTESYGVIASFRDVDDFNRYVVDDLHQDVITNVLPKLISARHSLQFIVED